MLTPHSFLDISISTQQLSLIDPDCVTKTYPISTAKNGAGEQKGSGCTPRGWHIVRAKIGTGQPLQTVFVGRRPTGEVYSSELAERYPQRDWILTRILWLGGLESGKNRYGNVDTCWRYIYIHGSPDHAVTEIPSSHGCVRMKNADMLDLFNRVDVGIKVYIHE
jgi:lipoprotein-anchoring transpeptidase ErfK/SrfK